MTQMAQMEEKDVVEVGKKVVYVSGPITAGSAWEVEQNVRAAEAASAELFRRGVTNICVHSQGRFMDGLLEHGQWMAHDFAILDRCDGLLVCVENFAHSKGTVMEVNRALETGKRCFALSQMDELERWAKGLE